MSGMSPTCTQRHTVTATLYNTARPYSDDLAPDVARIPDTPGAMTITMS